MHFLTDNSRKVFNNLSDYEVMNDFTFVGGSAIAFYLNHRLSEDIDLFTWKEKIPVEIENLILILEKKYKIEIVNKSRSYIDLFIDSTKVTFFANNWDSLREERKQLLHNIYIAKLPLLCSMKINTLSLRAKYRDYYDLYVLNKEKYSLNEIYNYALQYIPGITKKIFAMQIGFIDDIDDEEIDHLSPKYKISLQEIQKHFEPQIKALIEA